MWTAVRPRSTQLKLQNMELKQEHFRKSRHKPTAQDADQNHQEHLEIDVFCSLDFAVISQYRTSDISDNYHRQN
jgi:hypothetical protein